MATIKTKKRKAVDGETKDAALSTSGAQSRKKFRALIGMPREEERQHQEKDKKGRKRKRSASRKSKADASEGLPSEEQQRRQKQRELQKLALRLQREGKPYKRPPEKKRRIDSTGQPKPGRGRVVEGSEEAGTRPSGTVQVIVVPIFWNRKPEEKQQVIAAAERIASQLEKQGILAGVDTTNALSPGQKFGYWEEKGVKVRVECGPSDISRNTCVLAVSKKIGELAEKQTLQAGPKLVRQIAAVLGIEVDLAVLQEEKGRKTPDTLGQKRAILTSGDDLGGDFEGLDVQDVDVDKSAKKKRRTHAL